MTSVCCLRRSSARTVSSIWRRRVACSALIRWFCVKAGVLATWMLNGCPPPRSWSGTIDVRVPVEDVVMVVFFPTDEVGTPVLVMAGVLGVEEAVVIEGGEG